MSDADKTPAMREEPFSLGYYCVAFVDLLGQSNALDEIRELPTTPAQRDAVIEAMRNSVGKVRAIRETFNRYLTQLATPSPAILAQIPSHHHDVFQKLRLTQIQHWGVSDSFVLAIRLREDPAFAPVNNANAVWAAMFSLAAISLVALAGGIVLRGGVDVGLGTDVFPNETYGPAVVSAYRLESKVAEYPRIVVGDSLTKYLRYLANMQEDPLRPGGETVARSAMLCGELVCNAPDDGRAMVHFLSRSMFKDSPELDGLAERARVWVVRELQKHVAEGNQVLKGRYERLLTYFDASLPRPT